MCVVRLIYGIVRDACVYVRQGERERESEREREKERKGREREEVPSSSL